MIKTILVSVLTTIYLTSASVTEAQQPTKVAKIGEVRNRAGIRTRSELFLQTLRELGYIEGKNFTLETRYSEKQARPTPGFGG